MRRGLLAIWLLLFIALPCLAQNQVTVTATITSPDGFTYSGATGTAILVTPGNAQPMFGNQTVSRNPQPISGINGFGTFSIQLWNTTLLTPTPVAYRFNITDATGHCSFQTGTIAISGAVDLSTFISSYAAPLAPCGGSNGSVPFNKVTSGTNTNQNLVVGNGSNLHATGSGIINATLCNGVPCGAGSGVPFVGPNPWYDVTNVAYAGGAKCDGSTDDTAAFNAAIAAANALPYGTVYIPANTSFCLLSGSLNFGTRSGWLNIFQAGTIKTASTISLTNFIQWTGQGNSAPTSFQFQSAAKILATGNINVFHIVAQGVVLKNLLIVPDGGQTTAHTILVDGGSANITLENVTPEVAGTGDAFHEDESGAGGGFGLYIIGGAYGAQTSNVNHASIYLKDLGIGIIAPDFLGTYGIKVIHSTGTGGAENLIIGRQQPITTEALLDDLLVLQEDDSNGIDGIWVQNIAMADQGTIYCVRTQGSGGGSFSNIFFTNVTGGSGLINPASTKTIQGTTAVGLGAVTIPASSAGSVWNNQNLSFYANSTTGTSLNVARGAFIAGVTAIGISQDTHHFVDPVNGGNSISYSTYTNPVTRFDSAASDSTIPVESSNNAISRIDWVTPNAASNAEDLIAHGSSGNVRDWKMTGNRIRLWGASSGSFLGGDFGSDGRLYFGGLTNPGILTGTLTAPRTYTFPDTTGTICIVSICGLPTPTTVGDVLGVGAGPAWVESTPGVVPNNQTGTSYTILATDRGKIIKQSNGSASAYTLPQAGSTGFTNSFYFRIRNDGVGTLTITPTMSTIQVTGGSAASTLALTTGETCNIQSDNTNYFADCSTLSGLSGLTNGFLTRAISSTTVSNSTCDEGITTANTLTCTLVGGISSPQIVASGSNGGADFTEGTGASLTPATSHDLIYGDSTNHCFHQSLNNVDSGCIGVAMNHSGTAITKVHWVEDTATFSSSTVTITLTGAAVYTSSTSYSCSAVDTTTPASIVKVTQTNGSTVTFSVTSGATDVITYQCIGN